jgi:NADPH:quinone reductase-like Zn-dependent oxidoreductase
MIPETMKAVLLTGHGGLDKLVYRDDVPVPRPAAGEALIEVSACGMNNTDVWVREGAYGTDEDAEATASWRRAAGEDTLRARGAGRRASHGGLQPLQPRRRQPGRHRLYRPRPRRRLRRILRGAVPAVNAHAVRTEMGDAELATFCCAYLTGEHMLDRARVAPGERVLITGASGGVGSGLVQLCRARGAIPYAVASRSKAEQVKAVGAEAVIHRGEGDLVSAVEEATGGAPIDAVADLVAGDLFGDLLQILRPEGRYVCAGAMGGAVVPFDVRTMYLKHLELHGSSQGTRAAFRHLVDYIEAGKVKAILGGLYCLSDFHKAQSDFMAKGFVGKLVVVPDAKWGAVNAGLERR